MKTMYKARFCGDIIEITSVEVDGDTPHFVYLNGRKVAKVSEFDSYHETWQDAKAALVLAQKVEVQDLSRQLEQRKRRLAALINLEGNTVDLGEESSRKKWLLRAQEGTEG